MCFLFKCIFLPIYTTPQTSFFLPLWLFTALFLNTFWPLRLSSAFLWWLCLWKENNLHKPGAPCLWWCWNSDISAKVQVCGCCACSTISRKQTAEQIISYRRTWKASLCTVSFCNIKWIKERVLQQLVNFDYLPNLLRVPFLCIQYTYSSVTC